MDKSVDNVEKSCFSTDIFRFFPVLPPSEYLHIPVHNGDKKGYYSCYVATGIMVAFFPIWAKKLTFFPNEGHLGIG